MVSTLPLHPGVQVALGRVGMDETQVVNAIAAGDIASPHPFANIWLFKVRVTGTGVAERPALNEIAIRNPDDYLNPHFLQRCLGLPVVLQHPPGSALTSKEFAERTIGTLVLAFIEGDEVWAIAKVYDQAAAKVMKSTQLSTSPGVVYLDPTVNEHLTLDDGKKVLIEGKPALLDHLAICPAGVWDKGGPAAGVDISGESRMPDNVRIDATEPTALDKILATLTGIAENQSKTDTAVAALSTRFDAMEEEKRKDAEKEEEERQAAELKKLAAEEEAEAEKMEREDRLDRKDDEDEDKHSKRCDAMAERCDSKLFRRKDGESEGEHSKRMDAMCAMRKDAKRKDGKDMDTEIGSGTPREPERSDKARRDAKRKDEEEKERMDEKESEAPVEAGERKDGEGDIDYSSRMDSDMRRFGLDHLMRRSGETRADHVRRLDGFRKRQIVRKDALEKDARLSAALTEAAENRKMLVALQSRLEDRSDADTAALAEAQARADEVFSTLGTQAPRPLAGEDLLGYRIRLARKLQEHSPVWKDSDLPAIARADAAVAFANAENMIYDEARKFGMSPATVPAGELREIKRNLGGRTVTEFIGDPLAWMGRHMPPRNFVSALPLTEQTRPVGRA